MPLIPDFASLLADATSLQAPAGATYASGVRNAFVFTSRARRTAAAPADGFVGPLSIAQEQVQTNPGDFFRGARTSLLPYIAMAINPKSIRWKQPKRFTKKDTRDGSVFFHFLNSKGQNNDILTLEFRGSTGNIDPRGSIQDDQPQDPDQPLSREQDTGALRKFIVWQNLYLLSREPMLLPDGTENVFTITYISPLFPQAINFNGFFNEVLEFEENAEKPHSREYTFQFTVQSTEPDLDELLDVLLSVLQNATSQPDATATIFGSNVEIISP